MLGPGLVYTVLCTLLVQRSQLVMRESHDQPPAPPRHLMISTTSNISDHSLLDHIQNSLDIRNISCIIRNKYKEAEIHLHMKNFFDISIGKYIHYT